MSALQPRRRAKRLDIEENQAALAALRSTRRKIGVWQSSAAHLISLMKLKPTATRALDLRQLRDAVEAEMVKVDETVAVLPAAVRTNSYCGDVRRALVSLITRLE